MSMRSFSWLQVSLLSVVVAVLSSSLTWLALHVKSQNLPKDYHAWIHEELTLTPAQEKRLEPSEQRFEETKRHLTEVIRLTNRELARFIEEDRTNSPRVQDSVRRIHAAMGELQQATLQHIFEMRDVLEPEQYDRLLRLTTEALERQGGKK